MVKINLNDFEAETLTLDADIHRAEIGYLQDSLAMASLESELRGLDTLVEVSENTVASLESIIASLPEHTYTDGLCAESTQLLEAAITSVLQPYGGGLVSGIAMESFSDAVTAVTPSMEGVQETLAKLWRFIVDMVNKVITVIAAWAIKNFSKLAKMQKLAEATLGKVEGGKYTVLTKPTVKLDGAYLNTKGDTHIQGNLLSDFIQQLSGVDIESILEKENMDAVADVNWKLWWGTETGDKVGDAVVSLINVGAEKNKGIRGGGWTADKGKDKGKDSLTYTSTDVWPNDAVEVAKLSSGKSLTSQGGELQKYVPYPEIRFEVRGMALKISALTALPKDQVVAELKILIQQLKELIKVREQMFAINKGAATNLILTSVMVKEYSVGDGAKIVVNKAIQGNIKTISLNAIKVYSAKVNYATTWVGANLTYLIACFKNLSE